MLDANSQAKKSLSCTSIPCYWLPPNFRSVPFARISDIDFTAPEKKRQKIISEFAQPQSSASITVLQDNQSSIVSTSTRNTLKPTLAELTSFYTALLNTKTKPVALSLVPGFCESYVPAQLTGILPAPLSELYQKEYCDLSYPDLLSLCKEKFKTIALTSNQIKMVEAKTILQSHSKLWFRQRAGRITASKFKEACQTKISQPSKSLIKRICYPENSKFSSVATEWGVKNEKTAIAEYKCRQMKSHSGFSVSSSGFVMHSSYTHIGASPDSIATCSCCGKGVIEVKCPFNCQRMTFLEAAANSSFFMEENYGKFTLKKDHAYYYQMQMQMKVCETSYGDFVVWRAEELLIERIQYNETFCMEALEKATKFFIYGILPEVIGKWYSRSVEIVPQTSVSVEGQILTQDQESEHSSPELWCYCQTEESGEMIGCDNPGCKYQWFHTACLRINKIPKGKWFCPEWIKGKDNKRKVQ